MSMSFRYVDEKTGEELDSLPMEKMLRKPYHRLRVVADVSGESKTQQSHKKSCDVNHIIDRFDRTGQLPNPVRQGMYGDVSMLNGYYGEVLDNAEATIATADAFLSEAAKKAEEVPPSTTDQPASESAQIPPKAE